MNSLVNCEQKNYVKYLNTNELIDENAILMSLHITLYTDTKIKKLLVKTKNKIVDVWLVVRIIYNSFLE